MKMSGTVLLLFLVLFAAVTAHDHTIDKEENNDPEFTAAMTFLKLTMPEMDKRANSPITDEYLTTNVLYALEARREMPWGMSVPWVVFLNEVLPYASLSEPRDPWRQIFYDYYSTKVLAAVKSGTIRSMSDAIVFMNNHSWAIVDPAIIFVAAPPDMLNGYSVFQVMQQHNASCTGLSVFLVAALRSIGIPAHVAGVPHWNLGPATCPHGDASPDCGNHDWVEAWASDIAAWSFVDQRGDLRLNHSWFFPDHVKNQVPGSKNHSLYAASWVSPMNQKVMPLNTSSALYPKYVAADDFPMVWDWAYTATGGWDITQRYLDLLV
eukprot:PhM_4_TR6554/c0_g1_i1/m.104448